MALIIAFDPGACTGVAAIEHTNGRNFQLVMSLEYAWVDRFKVFNLIYLHRASIKAIVVEEFRLFENKTTLHSQINSEMPSARVIGIIELGVALCKLQPPVFQSPAQRKNVSVLPEHRQLIKRSRHCIDAYLHARYYTLTTYRKTNGK